MVYSEDFIIKPRFITTQEERAIDSKILDKLCNALRVEHRKRRQVTVKLCKDTYGITQKKDGRWEYVPASRNWVYRELEIVQSHILQTQQPKLGFSGLSIKRIDGKRVRRPTFVDVGCGIGIILDMASRWGFDVTGIEIDKKLAEIARNMGYNIKVGDALKKRYCFYDVIYYYCPFAKYDLEKKLEQKIEREAKVGAYLICNYKQCTKFMVDDRFVVIAEHGDIYDKGSSCIDSSTIILQKVKK